MTDIEKRTMGMTLPCPQCNQATRSGGHKECLWCEIERLRAAAWPGDGHWTREPAEAAGFYVAYVGRYTDGASRLKLVWHSESACGVTRWSIPLPIVPPVLEEP